MKLWQKEQEGVLMVNKEKVIRGLKCCASMDANACNKCMYIGCSPDRYCFGNLAADALALLKAQEPMRPTPGLWDRDIQLFNCGACGGEIGAGGIAKYCFHCGREVKWDG